MTNLQAKSNAANDALKAFYEAVYEAAYEMAEDFQTTKEERRSGLSMVSIIRNRLAQTCENYDLRKGNLDNIIIAAINGDKIYFGRVA